MLSVEVPVTSIAGLVGVNLNSLAVSQNVELGLDVIWYQIKVFDDETPAVPALLTFWRHVKPLKLIRFRIRC